MKARVKIELVDGIYCISRGRRAFVCKTLVCAEFIAELLGRHVATLRTGDTLELEQRIQRAVDAELRPTTWYPPRGAGDVIGAA